MCWKNKNGIYQSFRKSETKIQSEILKKSANENGVLNRNKMLNYLEITIEKMLTQTETKRLNEIQKTA